MILKKKGRHLGQGRYLEREKKTEDGKREKCNSINWGWGQKNQTGFTINK